MVLPSNSHVVDGAGVHILSGHHLLRLQGLVNTVDVNLDDAYAEATERDAADMAGNACCGWCFGEFLMVTWSVSVSKPRFHSSKRLFSHGDSFSPHTSASLAKRFREGSGMNCLFAADSAH